MRQIHNLVQGSDEWHRFRLEHFGASEAAVMLGISPYVKRTDLLQIKQSGIAREFSDWFQRKILDGGTAAEALGRPMAETIIGEELYPATYSDDKLSASCDGLTMDGSIAFEHKQWNANLALALHNNQLPDEYQPQCQQVMMVTGARRLLFMTSDGTSDRCEIIWVTPDTEWQKHITLGWTQFDADLKDHQPVMEKMTATGKPPEMLPALRIEVTGMVTASNLIEFQQRALSVISAINTSLQTDEDFASAEATVKWCSDVESRLEAAKQHALSQTASIDALFRAIDEIKAEARSKRLDLDKLVKSRKDSIRVEIVRAAQLALQAHVDALNKRLGKPYLPAQDMMRFGTCIKGLKSISSLRDAVSVEVANAKISASSEADRIEMNLKTLRELAADHAFLFHDAAQIVLKANDDLTALVKTRIADHKTEEERRLESERARIRQEEEARANKAAAERAPEAPPATAAVPIPAITPSVTTAHPQAAVAAPAAVPTMESRVDSYLATIKEPPKKKAEIRKHILAFLEFCAGRE